jgi:hypothetical protein
VPTAATPAGIFHNVTPLPASTASIPSEAAVEDISYVVSAVNAVSGNIHGAHFSRPIASQAVAWHRDASAIVFAARGGVKDTSRDSPVANR